MYDQTHMTSKDAPKELTVTINDLTFTLNRKDPFGHIFLSQEGQELPERYKGAYTTIALAQQDAMIYADEYKRMTEVKKKVNGKTESNSGREQLR